MVLIPILQTSELSIIHRRKCNNVAVSMEIFVKFLSVLDNEITECLQRKYRGLKFSSACYIKITF